MSAELRPRGGEAPAASGKPGGGGHPGVRGMAFALLAIGAVLLGAGVSTCAHRIFAPDPAPAGPQTVLRPTPDVIVAVRDLARLETAQHHVERVIDLRDRHERLFGLVQADDAILLVAAGDVTAGVDLERLQDGDVVVEPERGRARIVLPPPEILMTRLDNERTFVHTRSTDLMARRSESLETRARQEAESTLERAAIESGILDRARRNAERTVRALVGSLGYDDVEVSFRAE